MCEPLAKRFRDLDRKLFYRIGTNSRMKKLMMILQRVLYYIAFVKFGYYCRDIGIDDVPAFTEWLVRNLQG